MSKGVQRTGGQEHATEAFVLSRHWLQVAKYSDTSSGARRTRRPGFDAMMRDASEGKFDVIVVWKRDRLFRSLREHVTILAELRELGIDFASATEQFDTTTPMGKAMMNTAAVFAELERDLIIERTVEGVENARRLGKRLGRPPLVDPETATRLRAEGLTIAQIAKRLAASVGGVHRALQRAITPAASDD